MKYTGVSHPRVTQVILAPVGTENIPDPIKAESTLIGVSVLQTNENIQNILNLTIQPIDQKWSNAGHIICHVVQSAEEKHKFEYRVNFHSFYKALNFMVTYMDFQQSTTFAFLQ